MKRLPVAGPWITDLEVQYTAEAARSGWYDRAGEFPRRFEAAFSKRIGVRHAVALPHCTAAIHLALVALGIGPGDEVIVPEITWIATSAPVDYVGATAVFADIDSETWCLDAASTASCLTSKTRAIISVDLYGGMPDYSALSQLASKHGVALIEDAAQSVGATYYGKPAGGLGRVGVFSFHGSKTLTTGEGGMLVTNDDELHARVLFLRDHARPPGDRLFLNSELAFKYRMSAVQAALGLAQTERLDELLGKKREIFRWYRQQLDGVPGIRLNHSGPGVENVYWMVTLVLDPAYGIEKKELMDHLSARGIDTRPFFSPLSSQKAYEGFPQATAARKRNRNAYAISPYAINLPSALCLTEDDVRMVCLEIKTLLAGRCIQPTKSVVEPTALDQL